MSYIEFIDHELSYVATHPIYHGYHSKTIKFGMEMQEFPKL